MNNDNTLDSPRGRPLLRPGRRTVIRTEVPDAGLAASPGEEPASSASSRSGLQGQSGPGGVTCRPLFADGGLPLLVLPETDGLDLPTWAAQQRDWIAARLLETGALLFRGFRVGGVGPFEAFAEAVCQEVLTENGEHVPVPQSRHVQTPVHYSPTQKLLWHNENSFNHRWPQKILFCSLTPARQGGETPLVDMQQLFEQLPAALRAPFLEKGIEYVRTFGTLGLSWQTVFGVQTREALEDKASRDHLTLEWHDQERLTVRMRRPAAIPHPVTGQWCWINQALHWHRACLGADIRATLEALYSETELPRTCLYGDGSPIPDEVILQLMALHTRLERAFRWQTDDVMLVDNVRASHARNPYEGPRHLLVALGDSLTFDANTVPDPAALSRPIR